MEVYPLTREINKLSVSIKNPKDSISPDTFMRAVIRGGLHEIVAHNGGKTLCFGIRDVDGTIYTLQEYHIPDNGDFRGFLLSANDGRQTIELTGGIEVLELEHELMGFFSGLYLAVIHALRNGCEVVAYLKIV